MFKKRCHTFCKCIPYVQIQNYSYEATSLRAYLRPPEYECLTKKSHNSKLNNDILIKFILVCIAHHFILRTQMLTGYNHPLKVVVLYTGHIGTILRLLRKRSEKC